MATGGTDLRITSILQQVKSKLQENGIKLWLAPYYVDGIESNADIEVCVRDINT